MAPKKGSKEAPNILGVLWCFVFKMGLGERVHLKTISDFFTVVEKKKLQFHYSIDSRAYVWYTKKRGMCVWYVCFTSTRYARIICAYKKLSFSSDVDLFLKGREYLIEVCFFPRKNCFLRVVQFFSHAKFLFFEGRGYWAHFLVFLRLGNMFLFFLKNHPVIIHSTNTLVFIFFLNSNARSLVHFFHFFRNITAL